MDSETEDLRKQWTYLYHQYLPELAKAKDSNQPRWPVHLDHCFARIVLDNAVGMDKPWTEAIKSPAVRNMTVQQLQAAIALAQQIAQGQANLVDLDERSLQLRGKASKKRKADDGTKAERPARKSKKVDGNVSKFFLPSPNSQDQAAKSDADNVAQAPSSDLEESKGNDDPVDIPAQLTRIKDSDITPFRKLTLTLLCQVPRGRYSTYQAMSDYITRAHHKTCARAVGSALRNNPFAPEVPCHRILAADGSLGGFKGHWGEQGKFASNKREILAEEGIKFDSRGKVKGPPFRDFTA